MTGLHVVVYAFAVIGVILLFVLLCELFGPERKEQSKEPSQRRAPSTEAPKTKAPIQITNLRYLPRHDEDQPELPRGA